MQLVRAFGSRVQVLTSRENEHTGGGEAMDAGDRRNVVGSHVKQLLADPHQVRSESFEGVRRLSSL